MITESKLPHFYGTWHISWYSWHVMVQCTITSVCSFNNYIGSKLQSGLITSWQPLSINVCTRPLLQCAPYIADEFYQPVDYEARRYLHSTSSSLIVQCTQLSTVSDRTFPVIGVCVWNGLLQGVMLAPSLPVFCRRLKSHLFRHCFHWRTLLL